MKVQRWGEAKAYLKQSLESVSMQPASGWEKTKQCFFAALNALFFHYFQFQTSQQKSHARDRSYLSRIEGDINRLQANILNSIREFEENEGEQFLDYLHRHQENTPEERFERIRLSPILGIAILSPQIIEEYQSLQGQAVPEEHD